MKKILTVIGARPQFIKAAPVSRQIAASRHLNECLVHTGQHHDANMSDIFFQEMGIPPPAHHLGVSGGSHGAMTGRMLERLETVMQREGPDWVLVYGDTNSTLAGALAAAKLHIPVAHVEAGLRSFNRRMPEEINRVLTDHCADLLLTPTDAATANLRGEGLPGARIRQVGDVMYDAALHFARLADQGPDRLAARGLSPRRYVLATVHRQENTDNPMRLGAILDGLMRAAQDLPVVLPLHPRTRQRVSEAELSDLASRLILLDPLGYLDMIALERGATAIATDSGGVQKEAFFFGVPCVTLRDETEWVELVEAGWNRVVPPVEAETIADAVLSAVGSKGRDVAPYGTGDAAERTVAAIEQTSAR